MLAVFRLVQVTETKLMLALLGVRQKDLRGVGCGTKLTADTLTVAPDPTLVLLL